MQYNKRPIFIVYHVSVMGSWEEIVKEQLSLLQMSGLGNASDKIYVQICGVSGNENYNRIKKRFDGYSFSHKFSFKFLKDLKVYEFPSINQVQQIAKRYYNSKIFYFHTKGASHGISSHQNNWNNQKKANLTQWRKFMEYHTIMNWKICSDTLDSYDCCGVDLVRGKPSPEKAELQLHYSGNFWWANANYINRCHLNKENRYQCEFFIGTGSPRAKELMSSVRNLKNFYPAEFVESVTMNIDGEGKWLMIRWWDFYYDEKLYFKQ